MTGNSQTPRHPWVVAHPVVTFYLFAFTISWLGYLPSIAKSFDVAFFESSLWLVAQLLTGCGPAIAVALTLILLYQSGTLLSRLRSSLQGDATPVWCAIAIALPILLLILTQTLTRVLSRSTPHSSAVNIRTLTFFSISSVLANSCEEIGWRGFAFEVLERKLNPLFAAMIVGVLWGMWHIPFFLDKANPMSKILFIPWFITIVAHAIIIGWIYNRAGHSIAVAILYHVASNIGSAIIGVSSHTLLACINAATVLILISLDGMRLADRRSDATIS